MQSKPQPKILIVTGVLWIGGGAEKVAANLGNYFTDQGYETHLLTFYEAPDKYPYHGIYHSFNETPKGHRLFKLFGIPHRIWRIAKYARAHDINIAYTFLEEANFYVLLAKRLFVRRLPVVVSVRNNIRTRGWLFQRLCAWLYPSAKSVVAVTKQVEQMLIADFSLPNTTTIYNSLDMPYIAARAKEPLPSEYQWLNQASPLCISMGRLIPQKGQWHLIRAFSQVVASYPSAQLVVLGEGEYKAQLQQLVSDCGLADSVHFIGKHPNVYQFLQAADIFVFSSLFEGMPNTMLEALSLGLPIVSTDCPSGPREIIAPDLAVNAETNYPHKTPYGMLTTPFAIKEAFFETPTERPLMPAEAQLADSISDVLTRNWTRGLAYTAYKQRITEAFTYEQIMQEWEAVLTE